MDARVAKLVERCGLEEDTRTWGDITSRLFNGLTYQTLHEWDANRDMAVHNLINLAKSETPHFDAGNSLDAYFTRGAGGRLVSIMPVYFSADANFHDPVSGVTIVGSEVYIGVGVQLVDLVIRTSAFISDGARIVNTKFSAAKPSDSASYVGVNATLEDLNQFCKSVVGSSTGENNFYPFTYVHADAVNRGIIGGSTALCDGVSWQSHWTTGDDTRIVDIMEPKKMFVVDSEDGTKTPTIIGSNCRIGGGVHIVSPLFVTKGQAVGEGNEFGRKALNGLIVDGAHYCIVKIGGDYHVVPQT